jgi:hypothetical protein
MLRVLEPDGSPVFVLCVLEHFDGDDEATLTLIARLLDDGMLGMEPVVLH